MNGYRYGGPGVGHLPVLIGLAALAGVLWLDRPAGGYGFLGHGGGVDGYGVARSCQPGTVYVPQVGACQSTLVGGELW